MVDCGQGVGEGTFGVGGYLEGAEEGGDFGVGDEGLGVGDVFVVEDEAGFVGVEGPCFCGVCLGLFYVSDSEWHLDKRQARAW